MTPRTARRSSGFEEALTRRARTLRDRLAVVALVAFFTLTALAGVAAWRQYEGAKREAARELEARAVLAATVFDTYFTGQLETLSAIAASPSVRALDRAKMRQYFARFRPAAGTALTAGLGWIDLQGRQRVTSDPRGPIRASLANRSYFTEVVRSKKPFVSEAIVARTTKRRIVVMSVPTFDREGRLTGVLAGGLVLTGSANDPRATELGYAGLRVIDRAGQQVTLRTLARAPNQQLLEDLRKEKQGVEVGIRGLDGSSGRVVAYATAETPGWTAVIDQPTSTAFADARRTVRREGAGLATAAALVLLLIGWGWRRARGELRASRSQVRRWARFTRALNTADTVGAICDLLGSALASEFPDATAVVTADDPAGGEHALAVVRGHRSPLPPMEEGALRLLAARLAAFPTGIVVETRAAVRRHAALGGLGRVQSLYALPLSDGDDASPAGVAAVLFGRETALSDDRRDLFEAHLDQIRQAIGRVRRHEQEHTLAVVLQESLLPDMLPVVEGVALDAFYRAGTRNTEVGGDWYDVVRRPDGLVHFTVGDVAGRGIEAAVAMGQLRNAYRAYALEHVSPAAIVHRLARHVPVDGMATVACAQYDPITRELSYASAGHVPPLLYDPATDAARRLDVTTTGPLGWSSAGDGEDTSVVVPPDAVLTLYTDGLVEEPGHSIDDGIERLAHALEALAREGAGLAEAIVRRVETSAEDDIAMLLVRLGPVPGRVRIELRAETGALREIRRRVTAWLTLRGLDERAEDAILALNEACANAIEHGYAGAGGTIGLTLEHLDDRLAMTVEDEGRWREPGSDSTRGRGLVLMRGLMDRTQIERSAEGTRIILERTL